MNQQNSDEPSADRNNYAAVVYGIIFFTYVIVTGFLLLLARAKGFYPGYLPDEAQYALVGENLLRYGVFSCRGDFPALIPPLYPMFISGVHAFNRFFQIENIMLYANILLMASVSIPSILLARCFGLSIISAALVGAVSALVPNVIMVHAYMSEPLYYPVFVWVCFSGCHFLDTPSVYRAILVGLFLGVSVLVKSSAMVLIIIWGIVNISICLMLAGQRELQTARTMFSFLICSIATACLVYSPWLISKGIHLGFTTQGLLGFYADQVRASIDFNHVIKWLSVYLADIFLMAGGISVSAFLVGIYVILTKQDAKSSQKIFFLLVVIFALVGMAAIFSGYHTGELRERHMFAVVPAILTIVVIGLDKKLKLRIRLLFTGISLLLIAMFVYLLHLYSFRVYPLGNIPWVYGLSHINVDTMQWDLVVFWRRLLVFIVPFSFLWLLKDRYRGVVYLSVLVIFYGVLLTVTFDAMGRVGDWNRTNRGALGEWLKHKIEYNALLLVTGRRSYFQPYLGGIEIDKNLIKKSEESGLTELKISSAEVVTLYDIRMIPNIEMLKQYIDNDRPVYLLTSGAIQDFRQIGEFDLVRLYKLENDTIESYFQNR